MGESSGKSTSHPPHPTHPTYPTRLCRRYRFLMLPLILLSLAFLPQEQQPADARRQSDDERRGDPRRQVTCESPGGYVRCPAPNGWRGARMVRQLSNASCSRNVSWGYDKEYIWVTRGCRGVFDAGDEYANEGERVTCSSPGRRV